jgi:hypothetical protein
VATLEDAAEALVVKIRGLDSEIAESQHTLEELRGRIDATLHEGEREWMALDAAVSSFLDKAREERAWLAREAQQAAQAAAAAHQAVATHGASARSEITEGRAHLDAFAQQATALQPAVESLIAEAGEAPARSLAQRAAQIAQELAHALEEARDFLRNEVVQGLAQVVQEIGDRCQTFRAMLAEEHTAALQAAFDEWEAKVDALEEYVSTEGFTGSHDHARAYVDYALGECRTAYDEQLDGVRRMAEALTAQLQELAAEAGRVAEAVVAEVGGELLGRLDDTSEAVASAASALGSVGDLLASYSFVGL